MPNTANYVYENKRTVVRTRILSLLAEPEQPADGYTAQMLEAAIHKEDFYGKDALDGVSLAGVVRELVSKGFISSKEPLASTDFTGSRRRMEAVYRIEEAGREALSTTYSDKIGKITQKLPGEKPEWVKQIQGPRSARTVS